MTTWQKIIIGTIAAVLWLAAIAAKHFWPDVDIAMFVVTCASVIGALGIHGISGVRQSQGGFASVRLLMLIAFLASFVLGLTGCTTTTGSMYAGLATQAEAGIKVFDDNTLATVKTVLCAQPYSAIQRHPEIQPGVLALCGPMANTASLDANQLALLMGILQSSGVKLQAAPAAPGASGAK